MTASDYVTILGAIGVLVTVLGSVIVKVIQAARADIKQQIAVVQESVNGTASRLAEVTLDKERNYETRIAALEAQILRIESKK